MKIIDRLLKIDLPPAQPPFLWGPRKTGKTTYLKKEFPKSLVYNFLKTDLFIELSKQPSLFREQILAQPDRILEHPVILDEEQNQVLFAWPLTFAFGADFGGPGRRDFDLI